MQKIIFLDFYTSVVVIINVENWLSTPIVVTCDVKSHFSTSVIIIINVKNHLSFISNGKMHKNLKTKW